MVIFIDNFSPENGRIMHFFWKTCADTGQFNYEILRIFKSFLFQINLDIQPLLHIKYQIQILLVAKEKVRLTTLATWQVTVISLYFMTVWRKFQLTLMDVRTVCQVYIHPQPPLTPTPFQFNTLIPKNLQPPPPLNLTPPLPLFSTSSPSTSSPQPPPGLSTPTLQMLDW